MRIDIVVFDGVDELDALGPLEVLRRAGHRAGDLDVRLVARTEQEHVRGACGLVFQPDDVLVPGAAEIVVVPGGGWASRIEQGVYGEVQRGSFVEPLQAVRRQSRVVAGVCTGTMLLAAAGVISGRRASAHVSALDDLGAYGVDVVPDRVVDDGDLVTSGGVTSGIDLALWLVERELSPDLADSVAADIEYARFRPAHPAR